MWLVRDSKAYHTKHDFWIKLHNCLLLSYLHIFSNFPILFKRKKIEFAFCLKNRNKSNNFLICIRMIHCKRLLFILIAFVCYQQRAASAQNNELACNFDDSTLCGWRLDESESVQLRWKLRRGVSSTPNSGPSSDVSGNGYYIYLDTESAKPGDLARIVSPQLNTSFARNTRKLTQ